MTSLGFMHGHPVWIAALVIVAWVLGASMVSFIVMRIDKRRAKVRYKRRIPERTLLWSAAVGGAPGAWLAMSLLRHKTRHLLFRVLVPTFALLWLSLPVVLLYVARDIGA